MNTIAEGSTDATPSQTAPDWLLNPAWRQPQAKPKVDKADKVRRASLAGLLQQVPAMPPQLSWSAQFAAAAMRQTHTGSEEQQLAAMDVNLPHLLSHDTLPECIEALSELRKALAARDADGLAQRLVALIETRRGRPLEKPENLHGFSDWLTLGELAAPVWNRLAGRFFHHRAKDFVPALGLDGLPAMVAWAQRSFKACLDLALCFGDEDLARAAAAAAFSGKAHHQTNGKVWLFARPDYAASAHLADALVGTGKAQTLALSVLLALADKGHTEAVFDAARRCDAASGDTGLVLQATQVLMNADPLLRHPSRVPTDLPDFAAPEALPAPLLHNGQALPQDGVRTVIEMLGFARDRGLYAGLREMEAVCTRASLQAFAWALFERWHASPQASKYPWGFTSLSVWGDGDTARELEKRIRVWPTQGLSARAATGLEVLADMGSDEALASVSAIGERVKSRPLKEKAQEMMAKIALLRGLSAADLQDRLVPDLGLNARGELLLDFGPRQFLLRLDEALKPRLNSFENGVAGARVAKLPAVGARDDAPRANEATAQHKLIAKQAKAIATSQLRRLEAALREQRRWSRADFEAVYVRHPVLRQLAARLIWGVFAQEAGVDAAQERVLGAFRVNAEGELVTADDVAFVWPDDSAGAASAAASTAKPPRTRVGLLHPLQLGAEQRQAFAQVLADYELLQPFEQLGREATAGLTSAGHAEAVQAWRGRSFEPLRLLGLSSRGWQTDEHSGEIMGWVRALPGGRSIALHVTPGVPLYAPKDAGPQQLSEIRLDGPGLTGSKDWAALDAISVSELLRDLGQVSP